MYNSVYPLNINYRKHPNLRTGADSGTDVKNAQNSPVSKENENRNTFPNGAKVAIDYTKGQINISQVLADFRSTILAINAPDDVREEVSVYLNLVEKESCKDTPSKDIILANLKNASKISDAYITKALKKPSNVVEGWIDALFLQKINLKSNPNEINPDFLLEFPQNAKERIENAQNQNAQDIQQPSVRPSQSANVSSFPSVTVASVSQTVESESADYALDALQDSDTESPEIENAIELSDAKVQNFAQAQNQPQVIQKIADKKITPFSASGEADKTARALYIQAKNLPDTNQGNTDAVNLLNEALGILSDSGEEVNENIRAAIHFERGKIFDSYDYVDLALADFWKATGAQELNLKSQAFYKSASIYDEFGEFSPALSNYLSAVAYSGEAENPNIQTRALSNIAGLYAKQFDSANTSDYMDLAIETAVDSKNNKLIASTYSTGAQNFQYLGENEKALEGYKNALKTFSAANESYEQMAYNYEQASIVMGKLGNHAKAAKLQAKALQYYQKAQLQEAQLEEAS